MKKNSTTKKIIVNADDFGMSESVNQAILKSFQQGWISSTTLMANMPGFEQACQLNEQHNLHGKIGVHLNLTEGKPLSENIKSFSRLCAKDGNLCMKGRTGHRLTASESSAVEKELDAQISKCIEAGITPTHLDSHHHSHHAWSVFGIVIKLAKKHNIYAIRPSFNWGTRISRKRKIFSKIFNVRLRFASLAKTNYFCEIKDVTPELLNNSSPVEIMVHPRLNDGGFVTNYDNGDLLGPLTEDKIKNIETDSF